MFKLQSTFKLTEDQEKAVDGLTQGISQSIKDQVLLGVTGSGKTFTMANVIQKTRMPALIISHNKTLAGQLYQEMRDFFPENAVSYFVSYYDFYQPEAYIPQTDTYIEKEAQINETIDKLRLKTTSDILTRPDVVVVASVSCIYNIGSPREYGRFVLELKQGGSFDRFAVMKRLVELQYDRSEFDFKRGTFRVRGQDLDIYPAYEDFGIKITTENNTITAILFFDTLTGKRIDKSENSVIIYPAKHFLTDTAAFQKAEKTIRNDLDIEYQELKKQGKLFEAQRLLKRVNYDLEMIKEMGYVNGIENYSRYFDGRQIGEMPFSLLNYFREAYGDNWLVFIDESHMTVPQVRGMFNGDHARKKTLIEYGFRLKASFDNRPLKFDEFYRQINRAIYVSATPNDWEIDKAKGRVVEQLVRPTGIIDPKITVRPAKHEVEDLRKEIQKRIVKGQRVLVTSLTKRIAEDLTTYLQEKKIRAEYLHSDIKTLERTDILNRLRKKEFDVLVGINLLREGLDLPEVSLVAILDADSEGFLRSKTALIQTMGRAARHVEGEVIVYADVITKSIKAAIEEVTRRRRYQISYNKSHGITPQSIKKAIKDNIIEDGSLPSIQGGSPFSFQLLETINPEGLTPYDKKKLLGSLRREMKTQAEDLHFEAAIAIREKIIQIEKN